MRRPRRVTGNLARARDALLPGREERDLSIVVPAAEDVAALAETVRSVLASDGPSLEVLVALEREHEHLGRAVAASVSVDPRVRVVGPRRGRTRSLDRAVGQARGRCLGLLEAGDRVPVGAYSAAVRRLVRSGAVMSVGRVRRRDGVLAPASWAPGEQGGARAFELRHHPHALDQLVLEAALFRTDFWRDHVAGRSSLGLVTALLRAEHVEVLDRVVVERPHLEDDGGPRPPYTHDSLRRWLGVEAEVRDALVASGEAALVDAWDARALDRSLPAFAELVPEAAALRDELAAACSTALGRSSPAALEQVRVRQKIRAELVGAGRWADLQASEDWFADDQALRPVTHDGVVAAEPPDEPWAQGLARGTWRLAHAETALVSAAEHVAWTGSTLTVSGWAYRRNVSTEGKDVSIRAWLVDGEQSVQVRAVPERAPRATASGREPYVAYDGAGVRVEVDLDLLPERPTTWHLEVEVAYAGASVRGPFLTRVAGSALTRPSGVEHRFSDRTGTLRVRWDSRRGACLVVDPDPVRVEALRSVDGRLTGTVRAPGGALPSELRLRGAGAPALPVESTPGDGEVSFSAALPPESPAGSTWRLVAVREGRTSEVWWPSTASPAGRDASVWRRSASAGVELRTIASSLDLTSVILDGTTLTLAIRARGIERDRLRQLRVAGSRVTLPLREVRSDGERHELELSLLVPGSSGTTVAPSGTYRVELDTPDGLVEARAGASVAGGLPQVVRGSRVTLEVTQGQTGEVALHLQPPLPLDALGAYHVRRLRDRYRAAPVDPRDSVLFGCYLGEFATDSQLAIDQELAVRRPEITRLWGVADGATEVPDGSVPVLLHSAEWYDALASSRFLVANLDFGAFFRQRPHQRYLQTFHGHPFKSMGKGWWRERGFTGHQVRRALERVNREWDTILAPNEESAGYYREQYDYDGDVLVAGYPRCDALVNADATAVRHRVLQRLGVDEASTVILYAPTYRADLITTADGAKAFDALDLALLRRLLGDGATVLVRGHSKVQRESDRVTGLAGIVDVTDHPDVNDLILTADSAVLDYSSLRFDWAITGKPMVFFVPDLEEYFASREPLFPFAESAPGPWVRTTEGVAAALTDLPALRRDHAEALTAFNARFNALHDGHATRRVVDTFFSDRDVCLG